MAPKLIILTFAFIIVLTSCSSSNEKLYENAKNEFETTDTNKDHIVTLEEMVHSFDELLNAGFDKKKLKKLTQEIIDHHDKDNDNSLNWDEYLEMIMIREEGQRKESERKRLNPPELDSI